MIEEERKYEVPALFVLPGLRACVPKGGRVIARPPVTLRATYYDTADLRLARAGVSLRYRSGDDDTAGAVQLPWTVKLPTGIAGSRHEIGRPPTGVRGRRSSAAAIPPDLVALVSVYTRGAPLAPVTTLRTTRARWDLRDRDGVLLAEVADDAVAVLEDRRVVNRFREIEVERKSGGNKVLRRVDAVLTDAGARAGVFTPKHVRALGERAGDPPDLVPPAVPLPRRPSAADVIAMELRADIARILQHDPLVRLRAAVGRDDTAVHQMRVGVRRLRATLRQFRPLFAGTGFLIDELGWLADARGAARDAEMLRARLRVTAGLDPAYPLDGAAVERIDAELAARHEDAREALDEVLTSARYAVLVDRLIATAAAPGFAPIADRRAHKLLPRFAARAWHRLAAGKHGIDGAAGLDPDAPDAQWHAVRIRAKRARYVTDATIPAFGGRSAALATALGRVTEVLGAHNDAAVAAETWLGIAGVDPDDHALAITAGRLTERERSTARAARDSYPVVWRKASAHTLISWLP
jgi:CHAD domain-containing protein